MKLEFETLSFDEEKEKVKVNFLRLFYFYLENKELEKIGKFKVHKNSIDIDSPDAEKKFNFLLSVGFKDLKNSINGKSAVYIHRNSGIPLVGNVAFGIVDRNTNVIEVKPITGCNLDCVYCSVNEDLRGVDFVVEKDYIVEEFRNLAKYKECNALEAHIGTQGEPLLYADIIPLVKDLASIESVKTVSIDTNGVMLSKKLVDSLVEAGLTRFNLSINAIDPKTAQKIAGKSYKIKPILEIAKYISKKCNMIIAPVWVPGINDDELLKIVKFAKDLKNNKTNVIVGIQNFLNYRFGKNPVKAVEWDDFYEMLEKIENNTGEKLILRKEDFNIQQTKKLEKPFKKGQKIKARIMCQGRLKNEKIAAANNRNITVIGCINSGDVKIKLTRDKHNIFYGGC